MSLEENSELWQQIAQLRKEMAQYQTETKARIENYESELEFLRSQVRNSQSNISAVEIANTAKPTSRRKLLKRAAAGVAGFGAVSLAASINGAALAQTGVDESAIEAVAGSNGYGGLFGGGISQIRLIPATASGAPAVAGHKVGEFFVDKNGDIYYAVGAGGNTEGWRKLAGADTAGSLHLLPAAVRVAATFSSSAQAQVNSKLIATGAAPGNPPASSAVAIPVTGIGGIPTGAKGVVGVLTNVGATSGGNLRFWTGTTVPDAVNLNITGGLGTPPNLSVSFSIALDSAGKVNLGYGSVPNSQCGYAVDVTGYYL